MTKKEKLKQKYFSNPASLTYSEIKIVLEYLGFKKIQAKGSYVKFKHPKLSFDLVFPVHGRECKDFYKKNSSNLIKKSKINKK